MVTVTSITVEKAQAIEDATVVSGHVSGGHLYLVTHDGTEVDAGVLAIPAPIASWPVGSIFMSATPTNPATLLGGGTWVRWGEGRVPVSQDSTQGEFDTSEEVGGEKTHTLTVSEMPSHNHGGSTGGRSAAHTHNANGATAFSRAAGANPTLDPSAFGNGTDTDSPDHGHAIATQGGDTAHNNLQPYIVCYMWKRTA